MSAEAIKTVEIFFSYTRVDENFLTKLRQQLATLKRQEQITQWYDREISPGQPYNQEIIAHLNSANIILLLVSPDFIASDYCAGVEVERAMERHKAGEALVIPVVLRPTHWEDAPFGKLQALPKDAKPASTWNDIDQAFYDIGLGIRDAIKKLKIPLLSTSPNLSQSQSSNTTKGALPTAKINRQPAPKRTDLSKRNVQEWLDYGDKFYRHDEFEEALEAYEQAIYVDAENSKAHYSKCKVLFLLKYYEEALQACRQSIRLNPENSAAYYTRGNILYHLKHYEEALASYELCLRLDSFTIDCYTTTHDIESEIAAYYSKSNVLYHLHRYNHVINIYDGVAPPKRVPDQSNRETRGQLARYGARGQPTGYGLDAWGQPARYDKNAQVLELYKQFIDADLDDAAAYYGRSVALYRLKRYEEALVDYEQARSLDDDNIVTYYCGGKILYALKHYEEALHCNENFIQHFPRNIEAYKSNGVILLELGRFDDALLIYTKLISLNPTEQDNHQKKIDLLHTLGRDEEALLVYDQLILLNPDVINHYQKKIDLLHTLGRDEKALLVYDQYLNHTRGRLGSYSDNQVYINKGDLLYKLRRYDQAFATYKQAASNDYSSTSIAYQKMRDIAKREHFLLVYAYEVNRIGIWFSSILLTIFAILFVLTWFIKPFPLASLVIWLFVIFLFLCISSITLGVAGKRILDY